MIRRHYALGVDSIIWLFADLQASIAHLQARVSDLPIIRISEPDHLILAQKAEIERLKQTIHNKNTELTEVYQLNNQLQQRVRDLEKALEAGDSVSPKS